MTPLSVLLAALGVLAEASLWPLYQVGSSLPLCAGFHLLAVALLAAGWFAWRAGHGRRDRFAPLAVYAILFVAFFPFFGLAAVCLLLPLSGALGAKLRRGVYDEFESYLVERTGQAGGLQTYTHVLRQIRRELSFEPFVDIMAGREVMAKARAIEKLVRNVSRESVKLLKEATQDLSPEVRLQAANALLKMEADINLKIERAMRTAQLQGSAKAFADLGDVYGAFATSGLVPETLERYYLRLSADSYASSIDLQTDQSRVVIQYGRALVALGDLTRAKSLVDQAVGLWALDSDVAFLRNEVYFKLGRFEEVASSMEKVQPGKLDERRLEVLRFWANGN